MVDGLSPGVCAWGLDGVDFVGVCVDVCCGVFCAELGDVAEEDFLEDLEDSGKNKGKRGDAADAKERSERR